MKFIPPEKLHSVWTQVREGLQKVQWKTQEEWIVEDVYAALRNGAASLYLADAFFVVVTFRDRYDGAREMHIWCGYGPWQIENGAFDEITELAKELKCAFVTFLSPRRGWEENHFGYEMVHTLYRKKI